MTVLDEIETIIPFSKKPAEGEEQLTESARTDCALHQTLQDRMSIMSLLEDTVQDIVNPKPTYVKSLHSYLPLDYSHDDMIAINSIVDGEVNQDIPPHQDFDDLLVRHLESSEKKLLGLLQKYGVDVNDHLFETNAAIESGNKSGDDSGDDCDDDISTKRLRTNAVVATGMQKMSVEEFHQKILWERWSGNGGSLHSPAECEHLLIPHSTTAGGMNVSMAFKPPAWRNREPQRKFKSRNSDRSSKSCKLLSFADFMRSIPMFHALSVNEFNFVEENSTILSYDDQDLIISEGQQADSVFVVREGMVQRVKAMSNPTPLRRGDIFGDSAVTGQPSQATYISSGPTLLICIPPKIFNAILHSSESDLNISNAGVTLEDSILSNHIEKYLDVLHLFNKDDAEDITYVSGGAMSGKSSSAFKGRASTFNLSKQGAKPSEKECSADDSADIKPTLKDSTAPNTQDFRNAPRVSQVFNSTPNSNGDEDKDSASSSEADDIESLDPSSAASNEIIENAKSSKLEKPVVQPISGGGTVKRRRSSVLGFATKSHAQNQQSASSRPASHTPSEVKTALSNMLDDEGQMDFDVVNRKLLLELLAAASPELTFGDTVEHIVRLTREFFGVDRVGFFIVDKEKGSLILKVTQEGAGLRVPLKGIAGHIARTGQTVNIEDAYLDERFDPTMDMNTGYRTKQMLCVPVCDYPGNVAGVLQLINTLSDISFQSDDVTLAEIVAAQIGDVMYSMRNRLSNIEYTPIYKVRTPLRLRLGHVLFARKHNHLKCNIKVLHGGVKIGEVTTDLVSTVPLVGSTGIRRGDFDQWIEFDEMNVGDLPQACRVIFQLYSKNNHPAGWCGFTLFTYEHHLKTGDFELSLWDDECPSPNVPALQNIESGRVLTVELPSFGVPVIYEVAEKIFTPSTPNDETLQHFLNKMDKQSRDRFLRVLNDPIASMTAQDKEMVWRLRYTLMSEPNYLPKFLLSVNWFSAEAVTEAYRLLYKWEIPRYVQALQLLDSHYPDPRVRAYAVQLLGTLDDDELLGFMLQLTQLLKFETFHDSALVRFLLRRALSNPEKIGHALFWYLKAEMHVKEVKQRFGLILKLYMRTCGEYRTALGHQLLVMRRLEEVARHVQACQTKEERLQVLRERISQTDFPSVFQLPLNPSLRVKGIIASKCRVMESKKKPLWLTFANANPHEKDIVVMFKAGDDLRQDQLTLQVLSLMDKLWKAEGLDMCMSAYGCISTGDEIGMLEIVLNSSTLANIVAESRGEVYHGSGRKIMAALDALYSDNVLQNWLMFQNIDCLQSRRKDPPLFDRAGNPRPRRNAISGPSSVPNTSGTGYAPPFSGLERARERFLRSCAGYCVATFVMGIGDRHNDNIMMKKTGELFHIDFGHFLGNFKWKYGIKRERAPFVFTPAFASVLGGEGSPTYRRFVDLAVKAFNVLRKNSSLLVTLFSLMMSCGIPELQREDDISYLRDNLMSGDPDEVASQRLSEIIAQCLHTRSTQFNDAVHLLVHA